MKRAILSALLFVAPIPAFAQNWSIFFQASFSTAQNAELRKSFTVASRFGTPRYATAALPTCGSTNEGAIATDSTLHTFQYCNGTSWVSGGFGGGTVANATNFSSAVGFADGTVGAPSIAFTSDQDGTGTGFYRVGANIIGMANNGTLKNEFGTNYLLLNTNSHASTTSFHFVNWNGAQVGWGSASTVANNTSPDAFFTREGAATIQMGADVNGTPTTQTFKGADGITGTDVAGGIFRLRPGLGTGAGVSLGGLELSRVNSKATGTTAQTYSSGYQICQAKILSNTSATTTTIATLGTTSGLGAGVSMDYVVIASNGTLSNVETGRMQVAVSNNAGTAAVTATAALNAANSNSSGTLAATPTATVATNIVSFKVTPTWVTIVPTSVTVYASFFVGVDTAQITCN